MSDPSEGSHHWRSTQRHRPGPVVNRQPAPRPFRKILVGVADVQARSLPAVRKAALIAAACDASLELFHDIDVPVFVELLPENRGALARLRREAQQAALAKLERIAAPLRASGLRVRTAATWDYPAAEAIVRRAMRTAADLIVVPRRAHHRMAGLLGYTDWELLRHSPVPVLLVKSGRPYRRPVVLAAIDPRHAYAKPAGLDRRLLDASSRLALALRAKWHVMHAWEPLAVPLTDADTNYANMATHIEEQGRDTARQAFDRLVAPHDLPPSQCHLIEAHPAVAIPLLARRLRSSVVVMGAISRSGLKRLFVGNTAERVIDQLPCDLLVVKPQRFPQQVPRRERGLRLLSAQV